MSARLLLLRTALYSAAGSLACCLLVAAVAEARDRQARRRGNERQMWLEQRDDSNHYGYGRTGL